MADHVATFFFNGKKVVFFLSTTSKHIFFGFTVGFIVSDFQRSLSGSNSFISSVFMDIFDGASRIDARKVSSLTVFGVIFLESY